MSDSIPLSDEDAATCWEIVESLGDMLGIDLDRLPLGVADTMILDHVRALIDENRRLREMIAVRAERGEPVVRVAVTTNAEGATEMGMVVTARTGMEHTVARYAGEAMARMVRGVVPDWESARHVGVSAIDAPSKDTP